MSFFRPDWTDGPTIVLAPYALLKGQTPLRVVNNLDLRNRHGAMLGISVGRYATNALNVGMDVLVRRVFGGSAATCRHLSPHFAAQTGLAYSNQLINRSAGYAIGAQSIAFDGQAYSTAFAHDDLLCFWGSTSIASAAGPLSPTMEMARCSAGTATPLIPDSPLLFAHGDNEHFTAGDSWSVWLPGGSVYALIFDPGAVTTASAVFACAAHVQTYDSWEETT